jgi:hypothetical protein
LVGEKGTKGNRGLDGLSGGVGDRGEKGMTVNTFHIIFQTTIFKFLLKESKVYPLHLQSEEAKVNLVCQVQEETKESQDNRA